jgi:hypothetical protein
MQPTASLTTSATRLMPHVSRMEILNSQAGLSAVRHRQGINSYCKAAMTRRNVARRTGRPLRIFSIVC